jgi:hypothetical protein
MNTYNNKSEDDNFEWMTLGEICKSLPSVKSMIASYPHAFNVTPLPKCKRFADGNINLTLRFLGHPEHIEHIVAGYQINKEKDDIPAPDNGYAWASEVNLEPIADNINRAIAEAITKVSLVALEKGQWLTHPKTGVKAEFIEWSLVDELEIGVIPDGNNRMVYWSLEDILVEAS